MDLARQVALRAGRRATAEKVRDGRKIRQEITEKRTEDGEGSRSSKGRNSAGRART